MLQGRKPNLGSCSSSGAECYLISKLAKFANELVGSFLDCAWIRALTEFPINIPLFAESPTLLFLKVVDAQLEFAKDASGKANQ